MLPEHELEVIKTAPRYTLVRLAKYTRRDDLYEAVTLELYQRDTKRLAQDWVEIMTGVA